MVSGWFYPINSNQQKHNKAVSSNLFLNSSNWKNLRKRSDLDCLTNLDRGLDPDHVDGQQQQQQGFLRSRPSQPGRRSPPLKPDYWSYFLFHDTIKFDKILE